LPKVLQEKNVPRIMQVLLKHVAESARRHFDLFGVKGLLRRAFVGVPGVSNEFIAPVPNHSHGVLVRLGTTDVAAFEHVFVNDEYGFSLAQAPSVIIDAGANVGISAVYF